jgi:hypothetical protein
MSMAGSKNSMGIQEVNNVTFVAPVRVGTVLLPAGEYVVRHVKDHKTTSGCSRARGKDAVKVKCTLVPRAKRADRSEEIYKNQREE